MTAIAVLLLVAAIIPILRSFLQSSVAGERRLGETSEVINAYWSIGGIRQAVQLRGANHTDPLLIYIHGGPGLPVMPFSHAFQRRWEEHCIVVQWDQRNSGKTLSANGVQTGLTLDDFADDGIDLVHQLRKRYPNRPIGLVGHSWGTAVSIRMLQRAPTLFAGYFAIGQVSNFLAAERYGYETVLAEARRRNAKGVIDTLLPHSAYPSGESLTAASLTTVRAAEMKLGFGNHQSSAPMAKLLWLAFKSPDYRWRDLMSLMNRRAQSASLDIALSELPQFAARNSGAKIACPILMIGGEFDLFTPTPAARQFFDTLQAPEKRFVELKDIAHFGPLENVALFEDLIVKSFLPMLARRS